MFERCDAKTIEVFEAAQAEARRLGHSYVGTGHLLLALIGSRNALPAGVAAQLPAEREVINALASLIGEPPRDDATLLGTLGIDLIHVRRAARQTFGNDTVERLGRRRSRQPWQPWRRPRRPCRS